jgi:energy-coupling factor transporter ATP-binding protein EcfA2
VDQDHNQITVPVDGTSSMMLIAGPSGLGKSSLLRAQVCAAADQGGAQIAVVNPKRMDLAVPEDSSLLFSPVAVYPEEITELLRGLVAELDRRNGVIASQGADLFSSIGMGVLLVFIDELSNVMEAANRSTRILLLNLIRSGRAAGIFVVAATQSPRASVITGEVKNAARTRVAMAMGPEESKLVLGNMAAASLPMEQGAAIYQDGMIPVPVRTVHVEGHAWRQRMDATRTGRPAAVLEVEPVQAETKEEKVERHLREGMPQYKVEELVYGHAGGNASRQVKKIKESLGL